MSELAHLPAIDDTMLDDGAISTLAEITPEQARATREADLAGAPGLPALKRMLDNHRTATDTDSLNQQLDRDYYDGHQLNSTVLATLRLRHQPPIYTNRIRPAIDGTLGVLAAAQTDPRAYPRNPHGAQENAADVATKTLRFIADTNFFDGTKLDCAEEHQIEGTCAAIIEVGEDEDVSVTQIPWKDFFFDPRSRRPDFKDAKYMGAAKWMFADDVRDMYPERYADLGDPVEGAMAVDCGRNKDEPETTLGWVDKKDRRILLVEVYYREAGDWYRCVFCAAGIFEWAKSAYEDDKRRTTCPIEAQSCYIDRKLNRYGRVRDMRPIQDEINARRSRLLHLANSRQIQERELGAGAGVDVDTARIEAAKADGVIPSGYVMVPTSDLAAGQQLLLGESKSEIERMGPTPAVLGRQGEAGQSGRARLVLQQAGMTEIGRVLGRIEDWEERCYRQMWQRARQFWTGPKFVRVTDDVRAPEFIQINAPDGTNQIAQMDMDIIVDTVPDTANLQQEVWQDLLKLLEMYPPEDPRFQIAVEMSPIADKQRIIERIKAFKQEQAEQAQQGGQQAAAMQAAEMEKLQLEVVNLKAKALLTAAQTDAATQTTNVAQTEAFATFGPVAAAFGILPDQAGVDHAIARVAPENAPPPGSMPAPPPMAAEQPQPPA